MSAPRLVALLFACGLAAACGRAPSSEPPTGAPVPTSVAAAESARRSGARWSDGEIRAYYLRLVAEIGPADAAARQAGASAEERARRAYQRRHDARMLTRAMMSEAAVALLQRRDLEKYGHPDGPTLSELAEKERGKGRAGDAVWEAIVESAQRTDKATNDLFGVK